ncbi:MAG: CPBP family intramembrane metalloprotease [Ruminococcus sp.]|nr:CPBP family intramembrane metalloprotease [Ruminococcus sp.]
MFKIFKEKNSTMKLVPQEHIPKNVMLQCLIFLGVFIVSQIFASIPSFIPMMMSIFSKMSILMDTLNNQGYTAYMEEVISIGYTPTIIILSLYGTILATAITMLFCKLIERRPMTSLGFHKKYALKNYLIGCLVGIVLMSVCVLLSAMFKGISLSLNPNISWKLFIIYLLGFIFQGASEEVIFRGYFMNTVASKGRIVLAVILNSVFFGLAHSFNMGLTPLALLNLVLYGIFASIYAIRFDNIWGVCGIHSFWNFMQGNFWGVQVSGIDTSTSIFIADSTSNNNILNGGDFGLEGSIFVTIILILATVIVLFCKNPTKLVDE